MDSRLKIILIALLLSDTVLACRYNVRDIGFVDLNQSMVRLYVFLADGSPDVRAPLQALLDGQLVETNVIGELMEPAVEGPPVTKPEHLPAAVLVSPKGQSLVVGLDAPGKTLLENLAALIGRLTRSTFKTNLLTQAAKHFAVVLLIESDDTQKNRQASLIIETSFIQITQQMAFMPKPIKSPPVLIRLTGEEAAKETLLLWELGVTPRTAPAAAILYGRLRTMGPVLAGNDITEETLNATLGVIGADCECDLDRRLLHAPMLAHHWSRSMYEAATETLEFDPEQPQVKMEISQIIADHGPAATGDVSLPQVTFGYQEFIVDNSTQTPETTDRVEVRTEDISVTPGGRDQENDRFQTRPEPRAAPITPSCAWQFYVIAAVVILVTGTLIARKGI